MNLRHFFTLSSSQCCLTSFVCILYIREAPLYINRNC